MNLTELVKQYIKGAEAAMQEGERVILRAEGARQALMRLLADIQTPQPQEATPSEE